MPELTHLVLWMAGFMLAVVLVAVAAMLALRGSRALARRHLARRVARVQEILRCHAGEDFSRVDRLLFELGQVQDGEAVQTALGDLLEADDITIGEPLAKIFEALGLVDRYLDDLENATRWAARAAAARALGQLGDARAIPKLIAAMRDPHEDSSVKLAAGQAVARMKADEAIPLLIAELSKADDWASPRIAELLVEFGARARDRLLDALGDEESLNARVWAAQILGRIGDRAAVGPLVGRLQDRAERVRISATESLGRLGDRSAVPDVLRLALSDPVPAVRAEAARALGIVGDASVIDELVLLLSASDYWTRLRAVQAIEKLRPEDTYPLEQALTDDSRVVRSEAARALERLGIIEEWKAALKGGDPAEAELAAERLVTVGRTGATESLLDLVEHGNLRARARICKVLARIGDPTTSTALEPLLADEQWPVRAHAAEAIGQLRPANAADLLLPLLSDNEEMVRVTAISAIKGVGATDVEGNLAALFELYERGNAEARCSVIDTLEGVPTERVSDLLLAALDDPNADVRLHAVRQVTGRPSDCWTSSLTERLADSDTRVRKAAAHALGRHGSPDAVRAMAESLSSDDREFREILTDMLGRQGVGVVLEVVGDSRIVEKRLAKAWALGKTGDAAALDELDRLSHDESPRVRAAVAGAVAKIDEPRSREVIERLLADPNERVRSAAVNGAGSLRLSDLLPQVAAMRHDPHRYVRRRVAVTLGLLGGDDALAGLEEMRQRAVDETERAAVMVGFGLLGGARGRQAALDGLSDESLRLHVERMLAGETPDRVTRYREQLSLDADREKEDLSVEHLRLRYVKQMRNERDSVRRADAVASLAALGLDLHIDAVLEILSSDPEPEVRRRAVEALAPHVAEKPVQVALRRALRDPIASVQRAAVEVLSTSRNAENNEALLRCSALSDDSVGDAIIEALAVANRGHVPEFLDELMGFADEPVLAVGAAVLGHVGDVRAERLLSTWAVTGGTLVRAAAIRALGRLGTLSAREVLLDCLADPSEEIRCATAEALSCLPIQSTLEAFEQLASDPSVRVRAHLARALAASADVAAMEMLEKLCSDPDEDVRHGALASLLGLANDVSLSAFCKAFDSQPYELRRAIIKDERASEHADAALRLATTHRRPKARRVALQAAERLACGNPELLEKALRDPDATVRVAAVRACHAEGSERLIEAAARLIDDRSVKVRDAVRRARLSVVGDEE